MTAIADHDADERPDARGWRVIGALFAAQAIMSGQIVISIGFMPLIGLQLTALNGVSAGWATLPISATVIVNALAATPMSLAMGRLGRRPVFLFGALCGLASGLLAATAALEGSFALLVCAGGLLGVYQSAQGFFRFAAADVSPEPFRATAIGWVLGGGLIAAFLAPQVADLTKDLLAPVALAGVFLGSAALNVVGAFALLLVDTPPPPQARPGDAPAGRSLQEIFAEPEPQAALVAGMVSFALMALVMTSTSTAMIACGFQADDAISVIGAHVFAMFAPSFFVGWVVARIGHRATVAIGLALLGSCGVAAISGIEIERFYLALVLLGVGWSFGFVGATGWLASLHRPEERARVQGFNDMMVFGLVATASLASGGAMATFGWTGVNLAMAPFLAIAAVALLRATPKNAGAAPA